MGGGRKDTLVNIMTSPRCAAIEKAQTELRQDYDARERRRIELEFLEQGGDPLDFKFEPTAVCLPSISVTDQATENCLTSEAKGSFALVALPNEDSAESSGRPHTCHGEPHTADNLLFLDGENDGSFGEINVIRSKNGGIFPASEQHSRKGSVYAKEVEGLLVCPTIIKGHRYARRNRSRQSCGVICSSPGISPNSIPNGNPTLSSNQDLHDEKSPPVELTKDKEEITCLVKIADHIISQSVASTGQSDMEVDAVHNQETDVPGHRGPDEEKDIAEPGDPPEQVAFLDSEVAFDEKKSEEMNSVVPVQDWKREDGSSVSPAIHNGEVKKNSAVCEGSSVLPIDDQDPRGNEEEVQAQFVTDGQSSVVKGDIDSSAMKDTLLYLPEKSVLYSNCDSSKEHLKCDPNAIHKKHFQGVEANKMDVDIQVKVEEEVCVSRTCMLNGDEPVNAFAMGKRESLPEKTVLNVHNHLSDTSNSKHENSHCEVRPLDSFVSSSCPLDVFDPTEECSKDATLPENENIKDMEKKNLQRSSPQEPRAIKVTLRMGLAGHTHRVGRKKIHWDFALEEMAWLANDFMQERLWKIAAAAQVCRSIAHRDSMDVEMRGLTCSLAISVMDFWQLAKIKLHGGKPSVNLHQGGVLDASVDIDCNSTESMQGGELTQEHKNHPDVNNTKRKSWLPLLCYAVRFLKYDQSIDLSVQTEAPATPARVDAEILEADEFSEVNLFYKVPPGVMATYRRSLEYLWASNKKCEPGINPDECDASFSVEPPRAQEDEVEDDSRFLPGIFDGRKLKFSHRKRKKLQKSHDIRGYEIKAHSGLGFGNYRDGRFENTMAPVTGKRESVSLNVGSIPTKRVRTAARQRTIAPFSSGTTCRMHLVNKNGVSSEDTSSFQDDLSSLNVGSHPMKKLVVESTSEFVQPVPLETSVVSTKLKRKKPKPTNCKTFLTTTDPVGFSTSGKGCNYGQRWQTDQFHQYEQDEKRIGVFINFVHVGREWKHHWKDQLKKRIEGHSLEPSDSSGLHVHHTTRRLKVSKQLPDNIAEVSVPLSGSLSSPAASQMSNIANPNKLMKLIVNRERGTKNKGLRITSGQSGDGFPWTLFVDQALVVLVHDLGPNWYLVSDAINSTLQFKCIFRKPKECKDRHKALMDKNIGDGADSAEDSGTSQPYPSTLPGIPKGSARQLFKRLQEPMEDDILKAHFDKIIMMGSKQHCHKMKSESHEQMQVTPPHSSHSIALSQICTSNLSGGVLTPLDLCETTTSSPDALSPNYPLSHSPGLPLPNYQGAVMQSNSMGHMLQAPGTMILGNNVPAPLGQTSRDFQRHSTTKSRGLSLDDQHRMSQFNQMVSNRNVQQSGLAMNAGLQAGASRMVTGGNGVGIMPGMSRGMPMPRPSAGYQGMGSPSLMNMVSTGTSSMLAPGGMVLSNPTNIYSGLVPAHGNTVPRPREPLQMMRPLQPSDDQRQILMQELQLQVPQGNGQLMPSFSSINASFSNQMVPSPVQAFSVPHPQPHQVPQQSHVINSPSSGSTTVPQVQNSNGNAQQQAYMHRLGKEQLHQSRLLQPQKRQQLHHFQHSLSSTTQPHAQQQHTMSALPNGSSQPQSQVTPPPPPPQQSPQINQQQSSTPIPTSSSMPPNHLSSQGAQKQHIALPPDAASGLNVPSAGIGTQNQVIKQRHKPQIPQHRQQGQGQQPKQHSQAQQANVPKGSGRGNIVGLHLSADGSFASGLPLPGNQGVDKGDQLMHTIHGHRLLPGAMASQSSPRKQTVHGGASGYLNQINVPLSQAPSAHAHHQKSYARPVHPSRQPLPSSALPDAGSTLSVSQQVAGVAQQPETSVSVATSPHRSSPSAHPLQQQQQRHTTHSQQPVQRRLQNRQVIADSVSQSTDQSVLHGPNGQSETSPSSSNQTSTNSALVTPATTVSQWAPEELDETCPPTSMGHAATTKPPGSEHHPLSGCSSLPQRHYLGSVSTHGHNVSNNQLQQQPAPLLRQQSPPALQKQSRAVAQSVPPKHSTGLGGIYGSLPSSGPP